MQKLYAKMVPKIQQQQQDARKKNVNSDTFNTIQNAQTLWTG